MVFPHCMYSWVFTKESAVFPEYPCQPNIARDLFRALGGSTRHALRFVLPLLCLMRTPAQTSSVRTINQRQDHWKVCIAVCLALKKKGSFDQRHSTIRDQCSVYHLNKCVEPPMTPDLPYWEVDFVDCVRPLMITAASVSYTHLTLPTIYSV